jgi:sulfur carrier protein ThiS
LIEIHLHGLLAAGRHPVYSIPSSDGVDVASLLRKLGIDPEEYSLVAVDGALVPSSTVPLDGEVVEVYPFLGGG